MAMMTAEQYRESLRDGRLMYVDGHSIADITQEPCMRTAIDWVAKGYERFHLIRDLTADAMGGWEMVTKSLAGGGMYAQRSVARTHYDLNAAKALAREAAGIDHAAPCLLTSQSTETRPRQSRYTPMEHGKTIGTKSARERIRPT